MNLVHLHLLLNHFPVIGVLIAALLLAVAVGRRSGELAKASLALLALVGTMAVLVFFTGEPAQEAVEKLPGISERVIDHHEDAARLATIVTAAMGAFALGALAVYRRRALPHLLTLLALLGAVGSTAMMGYAANLGGQIRHTEIRNGSLPSATGGGVDGREADER
jgi:uncharacterized membrane protein